MASLSFTVPCVSLNMEAVARSVGQVRRRLVAFASEVGADRELQARVALAVSEAVTNVAVHAYPSRGIRPLCVEADFDDGDLEIVVADEGEGFRPRRSPGMGVGLVVIAETCDEFVVRERAPAGVELWMRFRVDR